MASTPSPIVVPVILSGGAGTRLWPLSREAAPKPFMPLPDGDTLLGKTGAARGRGSRARRASSPSPTATTTSRPRTCTRARPATSPRDAAYLLEPFGRNTAPAMALAALLVRARYGDDAVMLVLAADHLIRDEAAFASAVARAAERRARRASSSRSASRRRCRRRASATSSAARRIGDRVPSRRARFVEKPPLAKAREYLAAGNYVWNSGMFAFTPRSDPGGVRALCTRGGAGGARGVATACGSRASEAMLEIDAATFATAPDMSIDYAVMEKAAAEGGLVAWCAATSTGATSARGRRCPS